MIPLDKVKEAVVRRIARRIDVHPCSGSISYRASVTLTRLASLTGAASGHPCILIAHAHTPNEAVTELVTMLTWWLDDPLDPALQTDDQGITREVRRG